MTTPPLTVAPRGALTVGEPRENSRRIYYPVAPLDKPQSVVTVSYHGGTRTWLCHSCYRECKPTCAHIEAVKQHLAATAAEAAQSAA
jgi:hypothetical protein